MTPEERIAELETQSAVLLNEVAGLHREIARLYAGARADLYEMAALKAVIVGLVDHATRTRIVPRPTDSVDGTPPTFAELRPGAATTHAAIQAAWETYQGLLGEESVTDSMRTPALSFLAAVSKSLGKPLL